MEPKDIIADVFILISLLGSAFVYYETKKRSRMQDFGDLQKTHITESTELRRDLRDMLSAANSAADTLRSNNIKAQEIINTLTYEKRILESENSSLKQLCEGNTNQIKNLLRESDDLKKREQYLEDEIARINTIQIERIEHESAVLIENEGLKTSIKELKESVRKSIEFYEKRLNEKQVEIKHLTGQSEKQGRAIETLKNILQQNGITANMEFNL